MKSIDVDVLSFPDSHTYHTQGAEMEEEKPTKPTMLGSEVVVSTHSMLGSVMGTLSVLNCFFLLSISIMPCITGLIVPKEKLDSYGYDTELVLGYIQIYSLVMLLECWRQRGSRQQSGEVKTWEGGKASSDATMTTTTTTANDPILQKFLITASNKFLIVIPTQPKFSIFCSRLETQD